MSSLRLHPASTACIPRTTRHGRELGFPVLGAVSGLLGCIMALEAVKMLAGYGKPLLSEMLVFNTLDMEFRKVRIPRNELCEVCGT